MFINQKIKPGDKVTVTFAGNRKADVVGTVLGFDEHHLGLNSAVEQYIPWGAVLAVTIYERAPEETYSVEDSVH